MSAPTRRPSGTRPKGWCHYELETRQYAGFSLSGTAACGRNQPLG